MSLVCVRLAAECACVCLPEFVCVRRVCARCDSRVTRWSQFVCECVREAAAGWLALGVLCDGMYVHTRRTVGQRACVRACVCESIMSELIK